MYKTEKHIFQLTAALKKIEGARGKEETLVAKVK